MPRSPKHILLLAISSACLSGIALAQTTSQTAPQTKATPSDKPSAEPDYFPDEYFSPRLFHIDPKRRNSYIDVGAAVLTRPDYLGSDDEKTNILPYVSAEYKGRWFINPAVGGAGLNLVNTPKLQLSTGVTYISGRDTDETPLDMDVLTDDKIFDVDGGVGAFITAQYGLKYAAVNVSGTLPLSGDQDGYEIEVRLLTLLPLSKKLRLAPSVFVTYQADDWRNNLYGINSAQSQLSGQAMLDYDSDISSYGAGLIGFWTPMDKLSIIGMVQYRELDDALSDSPLAEKDHGITAIAGIARRF